LYNYLLFELRQKGKLYENKLSWNINIKINKLKCKYFLLLYNCNLKDVNKVQDNCRNIFTIIKSEQCTLLMNEKIALGKLFYQYLMDKGTSVSLFREVGDDIKKMEKSDKNTPTQANDRKRQLTETGAYDQQQKRVATSQMVTPTSTMTPQAQAYPSTAYYGDMNATSYQYNAQVIIIIIKLMI